MPQPSTTLQLSSQQTSALRYSPGSTASKSRQMFEYFTGLGNSKNESLTAYLTAPLMFRPAGGKTPDASPWFVDMALQPSVWGRDSQPPGPSRGFVQVLPFGELNVAVCLLRPTSCCSIYFCNNLNRCCTNHSKSHLGRPTSRRAMLLSALWCPTPRLGLS